MVQDHQSRSQSHSQSSFKPASPSQRRYSDLVKVAAGTAHKLAPKQRMEYPSSTQQMNHSSRGSSRSSNNSSNNSSKRSYHAENAIHVSGFERIQKATNATWSDIDLYNCISERLLKSSDIRAMEHCTFYDEKSAYVEFPTQEDANKFLEGFDCKIIFDGYPLKLQPWNLSSKLSSKSHSKSSDSGRSRNWGHPPSASTSTSTGASSNTSTPSTKATTPFQSPQSLEIFLTSPPKKVQPASFLKLINDSIKEWELCPKDMVQPITYCYPIGPTKKTWKMGAATQEIVEKILYLNGLPVNMTPVYFKPNIYHYKGPKKPKYASYTEFKTAFLANKQAEQAAKAAPPVSAGAPVVAVPVTASTSPVTSNLATTHTNDAVTASSASGPTTSSNPVATSPAPVPAGAPIVVAAPAPAPVTASMSPVTSNLATTHTNDAATASSASGPTNSSVAAATSPAPISVGAPVLAAAPAIASASPSNLATTRTEDEAATGTTPGLSASCSTSTTSPEAIHDEDSAMDIVSKDNSEKENTATGSAVATSAKMPSKASSPLKINQLSVSLATQQEIKTSAQSTKLAKAHKALVESPQKRQRDDASPDTTETKKQKANPQQSSNVASKRASSPLIHKQVRSKTNGRFPFVFTPKTSALPPIDKVVDLLNKKLFQEGCLRHPDDKGIVAVLDFKRCWRFEMKSENLALQLACFNQFMLENGARIGLRVHRSLPDPKFSNWFSYYSHAHRKIDPLLERSLLASCRDYYKNGRCLSPLAALLTTRLNDQLRRSDGPLSPVERCFPIENGAYDSSGGRVYFHILCASSEEAQRVATSENFRVAIPHRAGQSKDETSLTLRIRRYTEYREPQAANSSEVPVAIPTEKPRDTAVRRVSTASTAPAPDSGTCDDTNSQSVETMSTERAADEAVNSGLVLETSHISTEISHPPSDVQMEAGTSYLSSELQQGLTAFVEQISGLKKELSDSRELLSQTRTAETESNQPKLFPKKSPYHVLEKELLQAQNENQVLKVKLQAALEKLENERTRHREFSAKTGKDCVRLEHKLEETQNRYFEVTGCLSKQMEELGEERRERRQLQKLVNEQATELTLLRSEVSNLKDEVSDIDI